MAQGMGWLCTEVEPFVHKPGEFRLIPNVTAGSAYIRRRCKTVKSPSAEGVNATIYGVWQKLRSIGATGLRDSCKNLIHVCEPTLGSHKVSKIKTTLSSSERTRTNHLLLTARSPREPVSILKASATRSSRFSGPSPILKLCPITC